MPNERVEVQVVKIKDIYDFACRSIEKAGPNDLIPISKIRALAWLNNPCAGKDDIALIVGRKGDEYIGYVGMMPGLLKNGREVSKIYWLSTYYVRPDCRNTLLALMLIKEAMATGSDIAVTGMSSDAEKVFRGLRFRQDAKLPILRTYTDPAFLVSVFLRRLSKRFVGDVRPAPPILNFASRILVCAFTPIRPAILHLLSYTSRRRLKEISLSEVERIPPQGVEDKYSSNTCAFYRNSEIINWMLKHRWVAEAAKSAETTEDPPAILNYEFSYLFDIFRYFAFTIHRARDNTRVGFMVFSVALRNGTCVIKLLDYHVARPEDHGYLVSVIFHYAKRYKTSYIEWPSAVESSVKNSLLGAILTRKRERLYLFHLNKHGGPLTQALRNIRLDYCDGDMPFM